MWEGDVVLTKYMQAEPEVWKGKRVIELGAGCAPLHLSLSLSRYLSVLPPPSLTPPLSINVALQTPRRRTRRKLRAPPPLSVSLSLSLSLSIYLCISLSLYLSLSLSLSISLSPSLNLSLTHAPSLSHPLSLSPAAATLPRGVAEYSRFRNAA